MTYSTLLIAVLIALGGAYLLGRNRARTLSSQGIKMHSLATHYGALVALWTTLPPLLILLLWALLEPRVIDLILTAQLPDSIRAGGEAEIRLALSKVYNLANDSDLMGQQGLLGPASVPEVLEHRVPEGRRLRW